MSTTRNSTSDEQRRDDAREYVRELRVFHTHAWVFVIGMMIIFAVNLWVNFTAGLTGYWWAWWSGWALIGWGIAIGIHALVLWVNRPQSLTTAWEDKKVEELLATQN